MLRPESRNYASLVESGNIGPLNHQVFAHTYHLSRSDQRRNIGQKYRSHLQIPCEQEFLATYELRTSTSPCPIWGNRSVKF